jgi:peroxiredoxin
MNELMIISTVLLWIVLLFNLVLTLALVRKVNAGGARGQAPQVDTLKPGTPAPDFSVQTLDGKAVSLASYAGQATLFVAISSHCQPCQELLPELRTVAPRARRAGVELVLVSMDEEPETRSFVAEQGIELPVLLAPRQSNSFHIDYKTMGTPFYYLLDERGIVQAAGFPAFGVKEWERTIATLEHTAPTIRGLALQEGR